MTVYSKSCVQKALCIVSPAQERGIDLQQMAARADTPVTVLSFFKLKAMIF